MLRTVVVVALVSACGKSEPCAKGGDGKACLKFADEQSASGKAKMSDLEVWYEFACNHDAVAGCAKAGEVFGAEKNWEHANAFYMNGCNRGDSGACVTAGRQFRDGVLGDKDAMNAATLFKKGCDLKNDTACKDLAALSAAKPAAPEAPPVVSAAEVPGSDTMTDKVFCDFLVHRMCAKCASSHSWTQDECVKHQTASACARMTGTTTVKTPADFRARCAAAIDKVDCQAGRIPAGCTPQQ